MIFSRHFWEAAVRRTIAFSGIFGLPRIITGALTGVNLALAGCILQGILKTRLPTPEHRCFRRCGARRHVHHDPAAS